MNKGNNSKSSLAKIIWNEHRKEIEEHADSNTDSDFESNTIKTIERLIAKIEDGFLSNPKMFKKDVENKIEKDGERKTHKIYEYSDNFITLTKFIANLKFGKIPINNMTIDTFLRNCKKLQINVHSVDAIAFNALTSFFNKYYYFLQKNHITNEREAIHNLWQVCSNLSLLESDACSLKNWNMFREKEGKWLSENKYEIKKKLLLYCVSTRRGNICFAGKELKELVLLL